MFRRAIIAGLLPCLIVAACQTGDRAVSRTDSASHDTAVALTPNVVTIHATNYKFTGPSEIPAGMTTFQLVNDGPGFHHLQIIRFDSGKTLADFEAAMKSHGPPPHWMAFVGGPNAPSPTLQANATVDLAPGNYAVVCFVDIPEKMPHAAKGMVMPLTVTKGTVARNTAPTSDLEITLRDYAFTISGPVTAGKHTFVVRTEASQPHELELIKLAPGKTAKDMLTWMEKMGGPPPGEGLGGIAALIPGTTNYFTADLTAGDYLLICFVPDSKDGKPHFTKGMMQVVTVT